MALDPAGHPADPGRVAHFTLKYDPMIARSRLEEAACIVTAAERGVGWKDGEKVAALDRAAVLIREAQLIVDVERGALEIGP